MTITREDVQNGYRLLLGREPESRQAVENHMRVGSTMAFVENLVGSDEFVTRMRSPFFNYASSFDAVGTMRRHADHTVAAEAEVHRNFLGVRMRESYLPAILSGRAGTVEGIPIPANWHADIAEWAAVLRAVDLAEGSFTVVELGCGWGCWLNNSGVAARRRGLGVRQIGIEGDEGHVAMARDAGRLNGFAEDRYSVHLGLAAGRSGTALFPRQPQSGINWGLEPIFNATEEFTRGAVQAGTHTALPIHSLDELDTRKNPRAFEGVMIH